MGMDETSNPELLQIKFSLSLRNGADLPSVKSQLEELMGEELHIIDVRSIESINQTILKCSSSLDIYQTYFSSFGQKQCLPSELYSQIEDIMPDQDYLPDQHYCQNRNL
jgi:hypothetical protein